MRPATGWRYWEMPSERFARAALPLTTVALRAPSASGNEVPKPDRSGAIKTCHIHALTTLYSCQTLQAAVKITSVLAGDSQDDKPAHQVCGSYAPPPRPRCSGLATPLVLRKGIRPGCIILSQDAAQEQDTKQTREHSQRDYLQSLELRQATDQEIDGWQLALKLANRHCARQSGSNEPIARLDRYTTKWMGSGSRGHGVCDRGFSAPYGKKLSLSVCPFVRSALRPRSQHAARELRVRRVLYSLRHCSITTCASFSE